MLENADPQTSASDNPVASALIGSDVLYLLHDSPVRLASGILSPVYMDVRRLLAHAQHWRTVVEQIASVVRSLPASPEVIAGVAVGGVPHSAAVALLTGLPSCFVRKEAKAHGRTKAIEGAEVSGRRVVLVEDVITTGGTCLAAIEVLHSEGAEVQACVSIAGHGFAETFEKFDAAGVRLNILAPFLELLSTLERQDTTDVQAIEEARRWHADPFSWGSLFSGGDPDIEPLPAHNHPV